MSAAAPDGGDEANDPIPLVTESKRPKVFDDPAADHLLAVCLELAADLSVTRERLAAVEALAEAKGVFAPGELEAFAMPEETAEALAAGRQAFVRRLLRTIESEAKSG